MSLTPQRPQDPQQQEQAQAPNLDNFDEILAGLQDETGRLTDQLSSQLEERASAGDKKRVGEGGVLDVLAQFTFPLLSPTVRGLIDQKKEDREFDKNLSLLQSRLGFVTAMSNIVEQRRRNITAGMQLENDATRLSLLKSQVELDKQKQELQQAAQEGLIDPSTIRAFEAATGFDFFTEDENVTRQQFQDVTGGGGVDLSAIAQLQRLNSSQGITSAELEAHNDAISGLTESVTAFRTGRLKALEEYTGATGGPLPDSIGQDLIDSVLTEQQGLLSSLFQLPGLNPNNYVQVDENGEELFNVRGWRDDLLNAAIETGVFGMDVIVGAETTPAGRRLQSVPARDIINQNVSRILDAFQKGQTIDTFTTSLPAVDTEVSDVTSKAIAAQQVLSEKGTSQFIASEYEDSVLGSLRNLLDPEVHALATPLGVLGAAGEFMGQTVFDLFFGGDRKERQQHTDAVIAVAEKELVDSMLRPDPKTGQSRFLGRTVAGITIVDEDTALQAARAVAEEAGLMKKIDELVEKNEEQAARRKSKFREELGVE